MLQPHERPHPGRGGRGAGSSTTAGISTARRSIRWRCAGGSGWSSRSRTRSRSRSTTTSRSARASSKLTKDLDERVERTLRHAALWDEVKDRLSDNALGLSGGQQQRLCIARALAVEPDAILMDEPASALDPISTSRIEDLIHQLKREYTIVIVTHNMQQAARVADMTAYLQRRRARGRDGPPRDRSSSTTRRRRSSRTRPTGGRRSTSPGGSGSRGARRVPAEPRGARGGSPGAGRGRPPRGGPARSTRSRRRTSSSATRSIAFDDEIDEALPPDRALDRRAAPTTAPVATDLRLVLAVLHSSIHLGRIGDQSVTVAKLTKLSATLEQHRRAGRGPARDGSARCRDGSAMALDAFAARDVEGARELVDLDELIDRTNRAGRRQGARDVRDTGDAGVGDADDLVAGASSA